MRGDDSLREITDHDALSTLPTRQLLIDRLGRALARTARYRHRLFALLSLNLDGVTALSDGISPAMGEGLLQEVGSRLQRCMRNVDTIARLGEGEFVILLDEIAEPMDAVYAADRIQAHLAQPFESLGSTASLTASIGIALGSDKYRSPVDMVRDAQSAMVRAQMQGTGRCVIFDPKIQQEAADRLRLEEELRRGIERGELRLHYQPIASLATGEVDGFEALVRWQSPERGILYPADFLPVAEAADLIGPISNWVLKESCAQLARWRSLFPQRKDLNISVNLPTAYLENPELPQEIEALLLEHGIGSFGLTLEITESQIMEHPDSVFMVLTQLNEIGVGISLDDFGTGYSSLSYLGILPVQILKVDQSFVAKLGVCEKTRSIIRAICLIGECLGLKMIAEGVETLHQLRQLRALGCTHGQGFYFAKPLESAFVERLISHATKLDQSLL